MRDDGEEEFYFCELDGDLQPWDKKGAAKQPLTSLYDRARVWVYQDFSMNYPCHGQTSSARKSEFSLTRPILPFIRNIFRIAARLGPINALRTWNHIADNETLDCSCDADFPFLIRIPRERDHRSSFIIC
jgi:hypothetical protein